jgi:hypothetical protein
LNSGDWVENLTALEYNKKRWKLYRYQEANFSQEDNLFEMEDNWISQLISAEFFSK